MGLFNIYESLMTEAETSGKAQACIRAFGEELFAQQLGGEEPNTNYEDSITRGIKKFTDTSFGAKMKHENPDFIGKMNTLKSCISVYPEILHPEGAVYRGKTTTLREAIDLWVKIHGKTEFKMPYKANTYIQSWSENEAIAKQFGTSYLPDDLIHRVKLILSGAKYDDENGLEVDKDYFDATITNVAGKLVSNHNIVGFIIKHDATPDSFLFKAKYFKVLSTVKHEDEILRIGNNPLMCGWTLTKPSIFEFIIPFVKKYNAEITNYLDSHN
jgi:hypothetical protein